MYIHTHTHTRTHAATCLSRCIRQDTRIRARKRDVRDADVLVGVSKHICVYTDDAKSSVLRAKTHALIDMTRRVRLSMCQDVWACHASKVTS